MEKKFGVYYTKQSNAIKEEKVGWVNVIDGYLFYKEIINSDGTPYYYPTIGITKFEKDFICRQQDLNNHTPNYKEKETYKKPKDNFVLRTERKEEQLQKQYQGYNKKVKKEKEKNINDIFKGEWN